MFFFHWFIIADDGFVYFLLKIRKKPLNYYKHLAFSFCYSFLEIYLFFFFHNLLLFHLFCAISELLDDCVKCFRQISNHFMNAKFQYNLLFKLTICFLDSVLVGVHFDASGTQGKQTLRILTKIEDKFFWMEGAWFGFIDVLLAHESKLYKEIFYKSIINFHIFIFFRIIFID